MFEQDRSDVSLAAAARAWLKRPLWIGAGLVWMIAVGFGLVTLWSYENAPGAPAHAPAEWPSDSLIPHPHGRPALVMLLHPQCTCSRASVTELARLMARTQGTVDAHVLFLSPAGMGETWLKSDLWRAAAALPGVRVTRDDQGTEARRFGAATSGEVLLYNAKGHLQFSGGITVSRGHEGDNAGRTALESLVMNGPGQRSTFTFGCALFDAEQEAKNGRR